MEAGAPLTKNPYYLADIRLVLLGSAEEGKRSVGNTILGKDEFSGQKTALCVTKGRTVVGRQVTVINTPGWGREQRLAQTPVSVQEQHLQCVFPPGVHALLLVIRADKKFTEAHRAALQDHVELLGENVWNHTMVLFTCGDWLGETPIEQFIYSEGAPLQWVVDKCSYRYYRINNTDRADVTQVSQLLQCIECVVAMNKGRCFEIDSQRHKAEVMKMFYQEKAMKDMRLRNQQNTGMGDDPMLNRCKSAETPPTMKEEDKETKCSTAQAQQ
ncbi:GTPase IMAP family member 4-like [Clupea harengus]|uniref:GTPase IMAP family member 4-like n=1 Tax=Clupea harengus TaxID=7950 RepID=A0A6P8FXP2_CLUHA|nr:GTPase IMAP family member 4-like [Clupea harengus]XP_031432652.1 GTPase IMAP family member 4-like [Clupea harengus]XP_031432653.1 GTPase IMAP family member 4-like [Clupea harengus]